MIFTFLISIVIIAEIIIMWAILVKLYNLNKNVITINNMLIEAKQEIKEILLLIENVTEQILKIIKNYINKLKENQEIAIINKINKILLTLFIWKLNNKLVKKIRKNKTFKIFMKGFALIQNMI